MNKLSMEEIRKIIKESDERINSSEYIKEHKEIQKQCNQILLLPLNTKEDIQAAKEASRHISYSSEKCLLFRSLILMEKQIEENKKEC